MDSLGHKIRMLRAERHISQEKLGREIGIDRSVISKWETDNLVPSEDNIVLLCNFFSIDREEFLHTAKENSSSKVQVMRFLDNPISYVIVSVMSLFLTPFSIPASFLLAIFSIKKKMPIIVIVFVIFSLLIGINDLLFFLGIDLFPGIYFVN